MTHSYHHATLACLLATSAGCGVGTSPLKPFQPPDGPVSGGYASAVFGQRKRREAEAEAARESERLALFARLAERPENICPFLGLDGERTAYVDGVSDEHRCYAFGEPAPLSAEQQTRVCQERGYGNCPRYLRGVLVIPTEELEALRRPRAGSPAPPPGAAAPVPAPQPRRRRISRLAGVLVVLLLIGVGAGAAFMLFGDQLGIAVAPSPTPSFATTIGPSPSASHVPASSGPTPVETPVALPSGDEWPPLLPTPAPGAVANGWIVAVQAGQLPVVRINDDGTVGEETLTEFSRRSGAIVDRLVIDGRRYWVTASGVYTGLAYVDGFSGGIDEFVIFESFQNPDDSNGFLLIPADER